MKKFLLLLMALVHLIYACSVTNVKSDIESVLLRHQNDLLDLGGVEGVGIQDRGAESVIVVYVRDREVADNLPDSLEGFPVIIEVTGALDTLPATENGAIMAENDILQVLEKYESELLSIEGVNGVGIQQDEAGQKVIAVYASDKSVGNKVPDELDGYRVVLDVSGEFHTLPGLEESFDAPDPDTVEDRLESLPEEPPADDAQLIHILEKYESRLLAIDGVSGIGIQLNQVGEEAIAVYVRDESVKSHVPEKLDGYPVIVIVSGEFNSLPS